MTVATDWLPFLIILASGLLYFLLATRLGIYQRLPLLHYAIMALGVFLLARVLVERFLWLRLAITVAGVLVLALFLWFTLIESSYPRRTLDVEVGDTLLDRLATIFLPNDEGEVVSLADSVRAAGQATLIVFYRGWW